MGAFTGEGLAQLRTVLTGYVESGEIPGLVALVERNGDRETIAAGPLMRPNSIVRIASMTKPIVAAAALMLVEDGALRLDEPVDRLAPELAGRRVLRRLDGPLDDSVPARRPITLEDVLSFRLGWGMLFAQGTPILDAVAGLPGFGMPDPTVPITPDQYLERLGRLPLMAQPGERWLYTTGSNVLGVLVARAAGQPLEAVLRERVFAPLGMADTAFFVPPEKRDRLVAAHWIRSGTLALFDPPNGMYARPPAFPAGDSGLVSTADDFAAFARFLRTGLAPDGRRLLSDASLTAMTTDCLTAEQRADGAPFLRPGQGWGLGVGVMVAPGDDGLAPGAYGWCGGFGTSWFTDPAAGLTAILLTQRLFDSPDLPPVHKAFWRAAYAALAELSGRPVSACRAPAAARRARRGRGPSCPGCPNGCPRTASPPRPRDPGARRRHRRP